MTIPFALATAGWAALSAVGGALVGACAGGIVDWRVSQWREGRQAKAGARLIALDLREADGVFKAVEASGEWNVESKMPLASWDEYRAVLATRLTRDEFGDVARAVSLMQGFAELIPERIMDKVPVGHRAPLGQDNVENLSLVRDALAKAYNAIAKEADLQKVEERITPGPGPLEAALAAAGNCPPPASEDK